MKRLLTSFIFGAGAAVVIFAGTMAISPPIIAAGNLEVRRLLVPLRQKAMELFFVEFVFRCCGILAA